MKSKLKRKIVLYEESINRKRRYTMENQRSDLDQQSEADTHNTKKSDSCYSTGCSNSQSQRSESSKSIHSNSGSSNSSGYGGLPAASEEFPQPHAAKSSSKLKDYKKKKCKRQEGLIADGKGIDEIAEDGNRGEDIKADGMTLSSLGSGVGVGVGVGCSGDGVSSSVNANAKTPGSIASGNNNISNGSGVSRCEALHLATLTHTLNCIKRMKDTDADLDSNFEPLEVDNPTEVDDSIIDKLKSDQIRAGEFCLIVSMHDGKVLYATPTLTDVLGFPSDMWIGRSLIDFIHHKDRVAFANHITIRVAGPMSSNPTPSGKTWKGGSNTFFCCLRKYRGLKTSGFGVKDKTVEYVPFQLSLSFREVKGEITDSILLITATAVKTAYKRPDETQEAPRFVTRHLANCVLSHVDTEAISYLGYLPQDIIGRSIFEFYHPEDLPLLKEIYELVLTGHGSPFRSKPYRFRTQNGSYVLLETEWSSFINPWSRRLEFAIGQHRVLKGPANPDVFATPAEHHQSGDEVAKESKAMQEEIKRMLNEPVFRCNESAKQQVSKKCKDLATFMESIMDEITKPDHGKFEDPQADGETNFSEKDSVMLGEISPHHEYCDSKSSTETPPSYNQLNYNENLLRFFESKPKTSRTASEENSDVKVHSALDDEEKISPETIDNSKCRSPVNGSGTCSGSGSGLSSASNCINGVNSSGTNASKNQDPHEQPTVLTEAVLSRHNEDMEKVLVKRHRDLRVNNGKMNDLRLKTAIEKLQDQCHGVKRSGSQSWEEDKISKHRHTEANVRIAKDHNVGSANNNSSSNNNNNNNKTEISSKGNAIESGVPHIYQHGPTNINLWPPFSVTAFNQSVSSHTTYTTGNGGMPVAGMIPVYYIPAGATPAMNAASPAYSHNSIHVDGGTMAPNEHPGPPGPLLMGGNTFMPQVQFMNAFPVYPAVGFGAPLMYSPLMMAPQAPIRAQSNKLPSEKGASKFQRPASQATSVKAEPGSVMGSMVLSECSKKEEKSMDSPGDVEDSPNLSQDEDKVKGILGMGAREAGAGTGDESSYSSFSSFLKTDDSMRSSEETETGFNRSGGGGQVNWDKSKERGNTPPRPVRKGPPWLEKIKLTPELAFRYQVTEREMRNVLESDLEALKAIDQPKLVEDQLEQLYVDLELEGLSTKLKLDEGITTSSCSSSSEDLHCSPLVKQKRKKKRQHDYTQLVMIYEENMPLPSPANVGTVVTN